LTETGTEVNARVRIAPERKTVEKGALWYEESLPAETILAGIVWCDKIFPHNSTTQEQLMREFCFIERHLQMGGKATVGKGQVHCRFSGKGV
jgi:CRISPR-associated protein Cmr4